MAKLGKVWQNVRAAQCSRAGLEERRENFNVPTPRLLPALWSVQRIQIDHVRLAELRRDVDVNLPGDARVTVSEDV